MPSVEEEQERAVFDDDVDDDDDDMEGDDSEEDEEEGYEDDDTEAVPPPAFAGAAAAAAPPLPAKPAEEGLSGSTTSTSSSSDRAAPNPNPPSNPNPNPTTAADPGSTPQNGAIPALPLSAAAPSTPAAGGQFTPCSSGPVTQPSEDRKPFPVAVAAVGGGYDDSRRLFQRLWTDEEEITILQGFLEFTARRGTTFASHQYDTGPFYEEIKQRLQLEFTKNQLIEKLRRLKKKYRNVVSRMRSMGKDFAFKSSHEKGIYDIARNIWSANVKRAHDSDDDDLNTPNNSYTIEAISGPDGATTNSDRRISRSRRRFRRRAAEEATATAAAAAAAANPATVGVPVTQVPSSSAAAIPGIIEETVKSCLSPLFKELICSATGGPLGPGLSGEAGILGPGLGGAAAALSPMPFCLGGGPASLPGSGAAVDEKWKKQQILELEVYLNRIELLRDQIKSTLEELKSSGS
ncbi:probable transcription factor At3g04930 [Phoenix dactylifera]|uniref:Probable transcription factor At3g04930 n=1 Tax=Phoenix dactylifera TaxID=42345 RepID=A0A8B7CJ94_PHODC|nr:probable transcription factor At3g04930 [Phoenix dactylifera]